MRTQIFLVISIIFILLFVIAVPGYALQPPPLPFIPNQAPIDGGLGLLAAAGGAYAYKKLRARRKE